MRELGDTVEVADGRNGPSTDRLHDPARLARIAALDIVPGAAPSLDRLTRIAARLVDAPTALVTLVDLERQQFLASYGVREDLAHETETPLSRSYCQYVVRAAGPLVVADAREHPLLRDNPAIEERGAIAYAGVPVRTPEGHVLGSFCVIDDQPHVWSEADVVALNDLAAAAETEIALRLSYYDLQHAAGRTRRILDGAQEAYVELDGDDRVRGWNRHAEELLGWSASEVLGRRAVDVFIPERHCEAHSRGIARVRETGTSRLAGTRMELTAVDRTGREFPIELTLQALVEDDGELTFHAFFHDIEERKAAETELVRERTFLSATLESLEEAVFAFDENGEPRHLNHAFREMQGLSEHPDRAQIWEPRFFHTPGDPSPLEPSQLPRRRVLGGQVVHGEELEVRRPDAPVRRFSVNGRAIRSQQGRRIGGVIAMHDVTERHKLDQMKDQFFAMVTHELRNPVAVIRGYADLLAAEPGLTDRMAKSVSVIARRTQQLLELVDELFDHARLEAGLVALRRLPVELDALVEEAVTARLVPAAQAGVSLTTRLGADCRLHADPARLRQVLDNLVGNAVKYTPAGGSVLVTTSTQEGIAVVEVADTGIGIDPEERDRVFDRLYRAASAVDAGIPGTGLGLAVTKALVESHGGTVEVRGNDGRGTVVTVRLPLR